MKIGGFKAALFADAKSPGGKREEFLKGTPIIHAGDYV
jgi:hypothetical protein